MSQTLIQILVSEDSPQEGPLFYQRGTKSDSNKEIFVRSLQSILPDTRPYLPRTSLFFKPHTPSRSSKTHGESLSRIRFILANRRILTLVPAIVTKKESEIQRHASEFSLNVENGIAAALCARIGRKRVQSNDDFSDMSDTNPKHDSKHDEYSLVILYA